MAATDNGGQMGFAVVKVSVLDVNDNMPMFLMKEYRSNIRFDASVSSKILQVSLSGIKQPHSFISINCSLGLFISPPLCVLSFFQVISEDSGVLSWGFAQIGVCYLLTELASS